MSIRSDDPLLTLAAASLAGLRARESVKEGGADYVIHLDSGQVAEIAVADAVAALKGLNKAKAAEQRRLHSFPGAAAQEIVQRRTTFGEGGC